MAAAIPAVMKPYRKMIARLADALVLASRQAIGLLQTRRGLRVLSPLIRCSFSSRRPRQEVFDCASRRSMKIDGITSTRLSTNMNVM